VSFSPLLLTLAYVAVAALLLNLNLASRSSRAVKAVAILMVSLLYLGAWHGYRGLVGWPSPDPLPDDFRVLWISIEDPDKVSGEPGAIYYWVRELDAGGLAAGPPRAFSVPWDEDDAEAAQSALDGMEDGETFDGRRTRMPMAQIEEEHSAIDDEGGVRASLGEEDRRPSFEFVSVAPPTLPAKTLPEETH
jgi:hypothetical protein